MPCRPACRVLIPPACRGGRGIGAGDLLAHMQANRTPGDYREISAAQPAGSPADGCGFLSWHHLRIGHPIGNARQRAVGGSQHHVRDALRQLRQRSQQRVAQVGSGRIRGVAKLNAEVMSPTTPSRQAVMLGTGTPNRARINFNCEVWSNVSETISGPRLYGEMTMQGTRKPRPSGPRMPPDPGTASMLGTVTNSPGVPGGAVPWGA